MEKWRNAVDRKVAAPLFRATNRADAMAMAAAR